MITHLGSPQLSPSLSLTSEPGLTSGLKQLVPLEGTMPPGRPVSPPRSLTRASLYTFPHLFKPSSLPSSQPMTLYSEKTEAVRQNSKPPLHSPSLLSRCDIDARVRPHPIPLPSPGANPSTRQASSASLSPSHFPNPSQIHLIFYFCHGDQACSAQVAPVLAGCPPPARSLELPDATLTSVAPCLPPTWCFA